jgi:hypothetical protein
LAGPAPSAGPVAVANMPLVKPISGGKLKRKSFISKSRRNRTKNNK